MAAPAPARQQPGPVKRARAWYATHRKLAVAVVGAALTLAIQVWGTSNVWVSFGILAATSLGVYSAPNTTPAPSPGRAEKTLHPPGTAPPP
jgi:hypothetical protein